jgi:hypothetical protein
LDAERHWREAWLEAAELSRNGFPAPKEGLDEGIGEFHLRELRDLPDFVSEMQASI